MRSWMARHRSLVATSTSGAVVTALVATLAVVSTGYTAQQMDLSDPAVWVIASQRQAIARANTEIRELDSVLSSDVEDAEIVQSGSTILFVDSAGATVRSVDPATAEFGEEIALPPQRPQVLLAGDRVVIFAQTTGELWVVPREELASFDAAAPSTLSLGTGSLVTVTESGAILAYIPELGEIWRVEAGGLVVETRSRVAGGADPDDSFQLTAVGEEWVLLDLTTRELSTAAGRHSLSSQISGAAQVQHPSSADDSVLVAHGAGLLAVPLGNGEPRERVQEIGGVPTAPVVVGSCTYGAWTGGVAWRDCAGIETRFALEAMPGAAQLRLAVNGARVLLNDTASGASWAVQSEGELIDNWDELLRDDDLDQERPDSTEENPPEFEETQAPPVAVDDEFGARPGRASILPVLLNDYDPNGDVLVITAVEAIDIELGRLDLVSRNQQLQVTLEPTASGVIRFGYTISDGRGGVASAVVTVTVRSPEENSPPYAARSSTAIVASGGRVSTQVLGDWVDPDGDAIYLTSASIAVPDQVGFKPDGVVVFTDAGEDLGVKTVALSVSDGQAVTGGSLTVTVNERGQVPILTEPWVVLATAGQEVTVRPLLHVRGGNGTIRLGGVPPKAGTTIVPSFEAGTFTFSSTEVRTHYVEFTVTDGTQTATGIVRVDVSAPADASTRPITVPQTIYLTVDSSQTVDPTSLDIDPAGGVLVVTGVMNIPAGSGIVAEVLDQRRVRVTLTAPLAAPVSFTYRISNGLAEAEGTITVVEIPQPQRLQPPIANDDQVTVRVGDAIDIPVLDNDEHPDGKEIVLLPELAQGLPPEAGLLFVANDRLRYLAPPTAGNYTAVYTIAGSDGQLAQARVVISVREKNAATNNPPVPLTVTARVLAGRTVRIEIPTSGIDPDGDAVQLVGQVTNPEKGSVTAVEGSVIQYQAGEYSSGTDTFQYAVVDSLGARAVGTVRVGISPPLEGVRNPVANFDTVTVRPGRTVSVQALLNDSDPDGSTLRIRQVESADERVRAEIVGDDIVRITPPRDSGDYSVIYTIENETGGTSSNFIRVTVSPDAPLAQPMVSDTVLTVTDVYGLATVDVSVLDRAFFADGDVAELGVSLIEGYAESAEVLANKRVRVTIGDRSQIIPFAVIHPDEPSIRAYAFIWVPGYNDTLPQINRKAPALRVESESTLRIELSEYVVALGGSSARITDASTVTATHSNGASLVVDADTLQFTSADRYWGPASITFEVTDVAAGDPGGRVTTLSLPITVDPRENQPPVFLGASLDFEPGQEKEIDLVKLTRYPDDDVDELVYRLLEPLPTGFSYRINGQRLLLAADLSAVKGTSTSLTLGVRDSLNEGQSGRVQMNVVASTRPLARAIADQAVVRRGETTTIDVLANDAATNPFPATPLRVVDIRGVEGANLPAGISISPSADRSQLTVSASDAAEPIDVAVQYQLADATADPDRMVWGTVTISVKDVPDPVANLRVGGIGDGFLRLDWASGPANNSPIIDYRVVLTDVSTGATVGDTRCTVTVGCTVQTPGNGPSHAVMVSVTAVNSMGLSDPVTLAEAIWSDVVPAAPANVSAFPVDHGLRVSWRKSAAGPGSEVDSYLVTVGGQSATVTVNPTDPPGTEYSRVISNTDFANGIPLSYSVSARNGAPAGFASWNEAGGSAAPAGAPLVVATPVASASVTDGTTATVSWLGVFTGNGKEISTYFAVVHTGESPPCTVTGADTGSPSLTPPTGSQVQSLSASTTSTTFSGLSANTTYSFTVYAYNGVGCTASGSVTATPRAQPGRVVLESGDVSALQSNGVGLWDFRLLGVHIPVGPSDVDSYIYRLSGGTTDTSEYSAASLGVALTAGTSHYGNTISVELKACKKYGSAPALCSAEWSPPYALGRPVAIRMTGLTATETVPPVAEVTPGAGLWSWTAGPSVSTGSAPGYDAVTYDCGSGETFGVTVCAVVGGGLSGSSYPDLVVRVYSSGEVFTRTYAWADAPF